MNGTIVTFTGLRVDPLHMYPEDIDIIDIAHALARIPRFNGHIRGFYSVANHSIQVAVRCPEDQRLAGLMHDASEAYLCDIPAPIKRTPMFDEYREAEHRLMRVIAAKFGFQYPFHKIVHIADQAQLEYEINGIRNSPLLKDPGATEDAFLKAYDNYKRKGVFNG